jgi:hypothetical protein
VTGDSEIKISNGKNPKVLNFWNLLFGIYLELGY